MIKCSLITLIVFIALISILLGMNLVPERSETNIGVSVPVSKYGWPRTFYLVYHYEKFGDFETAQVPVPDAGYLPLKSIAHQNVTAYEPMVFDIALMLLIAFTSAVVTEVVVRHGVFTKSKV